MAGEHTFGHSADSGAGEGRGGAGSATSGSIVDVRAAEYGDPLPNHERIAALWSAYLGAPVTAHDVAMCMILVKVSRLRVSPTHGDSYVDVVGYADIAADIAGRSS